MHQTRKRHSSLSTNRDKRQYDIYSVLCKYVDENLIDYICILAVKTLTRFILRIIPDFVYYTLVTARFAARGYYRSMNTAECKLSRF